MKKLIIILFLLPVLAYGQIRLSEDYSFKPDKKWHTMAGTAINTSSFLLIYNKTKDENLAFRGGIIITGFCAMGKETFDFISGGEISLADMSYSIGSAILSGLILKAIVKRKKKQLTQQQIFELEY